MSAIKMQFTLSYLRSNKGHAITDAKLNFSLDVKLEVPCKGITAIFGPSGCGKTTLLRAIAGLETSAKGFFSFKDNVWQNATHIRPPHKRPIAFIFQHANLFSHLNVSANLDYAVKRATPKLAAAQIQKIISLLSLNALLDQFPHQLSGGEAQRVAIARALLINPKLILMDEPLASLDHAKKQEILPFLELLRDEFNLPIFYVTHSMDEVARLADNLALMADGKITAYGSLNDMLTKLDLPNRAAQDIGVMLAATIVEKDKKWHLMRASFDGGDIWLSDNGARIGQKLRLQLHANDVSLTHTNNAISSIQNALPAQVIEICADAHPAICLVKLQIGGAILISRVTNKAINKLKLKIGDTILANVKSASIIH